MKDTYKNFPSISKDLAATLFTSMPVPMGCWDRNGKAVYCSQALLDFFSVNTLSEYIENCGAFSPFSQPNGQNSLVLARQHFATALEKGQCHFTWQHQVGGEAAVTVDYTLVRVCHEGEYFVVSYLYEFRSLHSAVQRQRESEMRSVALFDASNSSICLWDIDLNIIDCNPAALRLFGFETKEELKLHIKDLYPLYQPNGMTSEEKAQQLLKQALEEGQAQDEWMYCAHDGELLPTEVTIVRIDVQGVSMVAEYTKDLRELRKSQLQSQDAENRLQAMFDSMPIAVSLWNKNYQIVDCNHAALHLVGYRSRQELIDNVAHCVPEFQPSGEHSFTLIASLIDETLKNGDVVRDWNFQTQSGEPLPSKLHLVRLKIHDEFMVAAYVSDLRELIKSEADKREAEERVQLMLDTTPLCANFWSNDFKNIDCNLEAAKLFGLKSKEEYLERFFELSPEYQPDGRLSAESALEKITTAFSDGSCRFEWLHNKLDGELIPAEISLIRVEHRGEFIVVGYTRDLRELKAMQRQTKAAEDRAQAMLDSFPIGANFWNDDFELIDCNMEMVNLFGFDHKEAYLENFYKLYPEYQPDGKRSSEAAWENFSLALEQGYFRSEWMCRQPNSDEDIPVELTLVRILYQEKFAIISYMRDLRELKAMLREIHKNEEDLKKARDIAEQSTKTKSEFLANMSHEIRTPMNGILGLLHLLEKTHLEDIQKSYVEKTLYSANNLLRIINDILDFSKIEAGKMEMESTPFHLQDVCNDIYTLFEPKTTEKGLILTIDTYRATTPLLGDPLRLKQVFFNLVSNAIKFTEKGSITVSVDSITHSKQGVRCDFSVQDTGIGLTQEQVDRLFSAFSQADTSVTRKYGGTGLGLAISKRIVEMMGGEIGVESRVGQGSRFYFYAFFALPDTNTVVEPSKSMMVEYQEDKTPKHERLLLVEDNEINQLIAEELLQDVGYIVDVANNGAEALEKLKNNTYAAVLMDIQMPVMDGLTASKKIRENAQHKALPIIAMSAHAMEGDKEISLAHGMNDHITKPISPQTLYNALNLWIKKGDAK